MFSKLLAQKEHPPSAAALCRITSDFLGTFPSLKKGWCVALRCLTRLTFLKAFTVALVLFSMMLSCPCIASLLLAVITLSLSALSSNGQVGGVNRLDGEMHPFET